MLGEQEGNFARLQLACSGGSKFHEDLAGLGWERGQQSAAALRLFSGAQPTRTQPVSLLRLQLLAASASHSASAEK